MKSFISAIMALAILAITQSAFGQVAADTLKTATIKVSGITCSGDMPIIKKKLINKEGVDEVAFTEAKNGAVTFTVKYHSSIITEPKIRELIEAAPSCDHPGKFPYKAKSIGQQPLKKQ